MLQARVLCCMLQAIVARTVTDILHIYISVYEYKEMCDYKGKLQQLVILTPIL